MSRWFGERRKRIQPVHLRSELAAAMRREKRELPYGDYAPNSYVISLNPDDFRKWAGLKWKAVEQLKHYLKDQIHKEGYRLEADLFIDIQESSEIESGKISVDVGFQDQKPKEETPLLLVPMLSHEDGFLDLGPAVHTNISQNMRGDLDDNEGTVIVGNDSSDRTPMLNKSRSPFALIKVLEGEDTGLAFHVDHLPIIVGRIGKGADIALHDTYRYISRQQLEISRQDDGSFQLTDLRRREDLQVYVNGEQAEPTLPLHSGDHIRLGTVRTAIAEMEFTVL